MQPIADLMTDRKRLKLKIMRWRALAVSVPLLLAAAYFADYGRHARSGIGGDYIAQIRIEGVMEDDAERDKMMKEILEDKHAKALLVQAHLNKEQYAEALELARELQQQDNWQQRATSWVNYIQAQSEELSKKAA